MSDVSLTIRPGEVFGLVGESGSGKSTLARMVAGLLHPDEGRVCFNETILSAASNSADWGTVRRRFQMIFQAPYSSLNPRMRVAEIVAEPIDFLGIEHDKLEVQRMVSRLLDLVEMPASAAEKFPHEFSGGQRQRIPIARARDQSRTVDLRRADLGPGRFDPGPDSQSPARPAGAAEADNPVHQPRSSGHPADV